MAYRRPYDKPKNYTVNYRGQRISKRDPQDLIDELKAMADEAARVKDYVTQHDILQHLNYFENSNNKGD